MDPHVSVGQVTAYEAIGLVRKIPFEAVMRMALVGRHERMHAPSGPTQLGMISQVVDPPETLRDEAQELGREDRPELTRRHGRDQAGAVGRPRAGPDRRLPGRGRRSWCPCGATPTRRRDPRVRREARAELGDLRCDPPTAQEDGPNDRTRRLRSVIYLTFEPRLSGRARWVG